MPIDIEQWRPAGPFPPTEVKRVDLSRLRRFRGVSDMPALMAEPTSRGQFRPLVQFVMVWNRYPELRSGMLDGAPPEGGDRFHLAAIAAVVHSLCARDGFEVPEWASLYRAEPERTISDIPVTTDFGRIVKAGAPPQCAHHGVYFDAEFLDR